MTLWLLDDQVAVHPPRTKRQSDDLDEKWVERFRREQGSRSVAPGTGERILFDHVTLERGDLHAAHLTTTCFFDCNLAGVDVSESKLPGARFHGSDLLEIKGGEYLRDIVIDSTQVLPLANQVFAGLNIRVEDDRDANEYEHG